jgi:acyl-CoA dehydrogenase
MAWDFETPADVQERLDWADAFVREEVELLDYLIADPRDLDDPIRRRLIPPLQEIVKQKGMWASHLAKEDGGSGVGHVEATLLNEILGRTNCGPTVFGCQSPDAGNAEILATFATPDQRVRFLDPLVDGSVISAFAVTEPQGGGDPNVYETTATLDGDEWVLDGEKWFISGGSRSNFAIVMAITDPENPWYERMSLFIVPQPTQGLDVVRDVFVFGNNDGEPHTYLRLTGVRVPPGNMLGTRGAAFKIMQARMGIARLLLATRSLGQLQQTFDMMCERAVSRHTQGEPLAQKQLVQSMIAETWMELAQFRLFVLHTAWKLERLGNKREMRTDISAVKAQLARLMKNTALRAIQIHGSIGVSAEVPFMQMLGHGITLGIADGPTEVHEVTLAKDILRTYEPVDGIFPSRHSLAMRGAALAKYADTLAEVGVSPPRG